MTGHRRLPPCSRSGRTLLAVVVCVICLLIVLALFFPALEATRETARRMSCSNNFKQIGLGFHNYHAAYSQLPPGCGGTGPTPGDDDLSNQQRLSALVPIVPFLEASPMWQSISNPYETGDEPTPEFSEHDQKFIKGDAYYRDRFDELSTAPGPLTSEDGTRYFPAMGPAPWRASVYPPWQEGMRTYRCPSDPSERPTKHAGLTNYACSYGDGVDTIGERVESISQRGVFANGRARCFDDITDGMANTLMMAEVATFQGTRSATGSIAANIAGLQEDPWQCLATVDQQGNYRSGITLRMTPDGKASRGGNWADGAICWTGITTVLPPNSPSCDTSIDSRLEGVFSAASRHAGGCHVLMADGAVKFITDSVDTGDLTQPSVYPDSLSPAAIDSPYGVWGALGSIQGKE
ncbi:DUF1559 domain-containing protein [Allorhodopirellula solitaria]|uniref:DUF1559 domain-containing protein n=1 Tax=Allorhodopirellula solitaria TaxID=2527987 RepID=UPI00164829CD|nr:DUF1559 domain-containing protein [Allorhodopirellula solitaria]